jgi:hypothetical protein
VGLTVLAVVTGWVRLKHSKARRQRQLAQEPGVAVDPDTGEILDP